MADIAPTIIEGEAKTFIASWTLGADDVGLPVRYAGAADRTVQIVGTFGGATVTLQGSINGTDWASLTDAQGNAIAVTSAAIEAVTELVRFVRPLATGGSGTNITVLLLMRTTI